MVKQRDKQEFTFYQKTIIREGVSEWELVNFSGISFWENLGERREFSGLPIRKSPRVAETSNNLVF